jgi:3',5'-cyclic AMP phosphodiesterase CpdA
MSNYIKHNGTNDGVDRRGFLKCMAWVGTGLIWTARGGVLSSRAFAAAADLLPNDSDFTFAQISDSHIGFSKEPNKNVVSTLELAIDRLNAMPAHPDLLLHTGDLTHLSKPAEFDTVAQVLRRANVGRIFYCPGEHDFFADEGKAYLERYGKGTLGSGWQSFTHRGIHFVGLVNVANLQPGGLGMLGREQLDWLKNDLAGLGTSTPIVVFAHVPLWSVYPQWGWGTSDSEEALSHLRRFASVTVLNGHIHQVLQKVEGNVTFHTACSTAFPQPAPGTAESPGPIKNVPADRLKSLLGLARIDYRQNASTLAIVDQSLA